MNSGLNVALRHFTNNCLVGKFGYSQTNVSRWVREYRQENDPPVEGAASRGDLETENKRLRKENQRLQMEREILKKAAAFFAKESS